MTFVFKIIYNIFTVCIALIAVLLIISIFPVTGNYKVLIVQSSSMEPLLKVGSLVVAKPASSYEVGDIITFNYDNTLITHRIYSSEIERGQNIFTTKGDANNAADKNKVFEKQIVGKVYLAVPYVGYAVNSARQPLGFFLIIVLPAGIIIFDEVKKILGEIKKIKNAKTA